MVQNLLLFLSSGRKVGEIKIQTLENLVFAFRGLK